MSCAALRPNLDFSPPLSFHRPKPLGRELDADPGRRVDAQLVGDREQHVDLAELLDDDEHLMAELLAHEREAHELLVLVAVADDQMLGAVGEAQDGLQLRLGAALQTRRRACSRTGRSLRRRGAAD
jgi:hypothetical protein